MANDVICYFWLSHIIHIVPRLGCVCVVFVAGLSYPRYKETQSSSQVQQTGNHWKAMSWSEYCAYFTSPDRGEDRLSKAEALRAWMRDLQGVHGVESFKSKARPVVRRQRKGKTKFSSTQQLIKSLSLSEYGLIPDELKDCDIFGW